MWRRVSCEQPLNTSQSILNPTRSRYHCMGVMKTWIPTLIRRKGIWFQFQNLVTEPLFLICSSRVYHRGNPKRPGDAIRTPRKSFLFCMSNYARPGIPSRRDRVTVTKSAAVIVASGKFCWTLKIQERDTGVSHQFVPISAAGLRGEKPLVDRTM